MFRFDQLLGNFNIGSQMRFIEHRAQYHVDARGAESVRQHCAVNIAAAACIGAGERAVRDDPAAAAGETIGVASGKAVGELVDQAVAARLVQRRNRVDIARHTIRADFSGSDLRIEKREKLAAEIVGAAIVQKQDIDCLLYTSPSPRDS